MCFLSTEKSANTNKNLKISKTPNTAGEIESKLIQISEFINIGKRVLTIITFSDIIITENVITRGGDIVRDNIRGGALTEVTFFILLSLYQPKHGYAVMQFIEEKTEGRLILGAGTLYGALNTLKEKGWIEPCGDGEGRKKEFVITAQGREAAAAELSRLRSLAAIAEEIITGGIR